MCLSNCVSHGANGQIGSGSGHVKRVCGSKQVMGQNGSIGSLVESGRVDPYFSNNFFFFFEIDVICQLFMSSLTVIRFSFVILLPITTKHFT